jgi:hypothetical protein
MSGKYHHVDKGEIKGTIANLNLSDAKTMECLKVQLELHELQQKKKAIEANLSGLNAELAHVEHGEKEIKDWKEWWGKGVEEMERNPKVILIGEDIGKNGGVKASIKFGALWGLA